VSLASSLRALVPALAVALALAACGGDSATTSTDIADAVGDTAGKPDLVGGDGVAHGDLVTTEDLGDGVTAVIVDATDEASWVYVDLSTLTQVHPTDPATDDGWDLAFQRFRIASNGGISGGGTVRVAVLDGADWDTLSDAPSDGWRTDAADGDDEDEDADLAFLVDGGWYVYDGTNHTLAPRPERVYVLEAHDGSYFKIRVVDYYDAAGSAGAITFHVASVAAPTSSHPDELVVAAAEGTVYVDLGSASVVTPSEPASSTGWDLGLEGYGLVTNGGTSGPGWGAAMLAEGGYDALTSADTVGFAPDEMVPVAGPPGSGEVSANPVLADWFDYDVSTHVVTPKDVAFLVRRSDGSYAKLEILDRDERGWTFRTAAVIRSPAVHEVTFSAPGPDPVYLSLRAGGVVEVEDAASSMGWDLAFSSVIVRTNGGTSGGGQGAAAALGGSAFDTVTEVPAEPGWAEDAMVPLPGPPGSGETNGNAVIGAWYDYDPQTHAVSATADLTFLVRAADGTVAKVQIAESDGTDYTLRWVYAGPGATSFEAGE